MDENGESKAELTSEIPASNSPPPPQSISDAMYSVSHDFGVPAPTPLHANLNPLVNGEIRTLDGEIAGDEFASDAINYQVLLNKIDELLEKLKLDA